MPVQIQLRRDTAANWVTNDPVLAEGELGHETDATVLKIGDGATLYSALPNLLTGTVAFGEYVGPFDASIGTFPVTVNQGDWYNCTVAGTVDGQAFVVGDLLIALVDAPSTVTFAANWTLVPNISVTDHTLLTNIGVNTHPQIDAHIADASIHFTEASIDHTSISNVGANTHAQIDAHIADVANPHTVTQAQVGLANVDNTADADKPVSTAQAAADALSLLLDASNGPLTGTLATQDITPDAGDTRNVGTAAIRFDRLHSNSINAVIDASVGTGPTSVITAPGGSNVIGQVDNISDSLTSLASIEVTGLGAFATGRATQTDAGAASVSTARIVASGNGALAQGNAFSGAAGTGRLSATSFGSSALGYAVGINGSSGVVEATNFGCFAQGFSLGFNGAPARIAATGGGAFAQGNIFFFAGVAGSNIVASGPGSFAQGSCSQDSDMLSQALGSFTQGAVAGGSITCTGLADGGFAQGFASLGANITVSGVGAFAQGRAATNDIVASGSGAFAHGDAVTGTIVASGANSTQFGPGTNAEDDTLQVGNSGLRLKGTLGAPGVLQDGDIFMIGTDINIRSNGVTMGPFNQPAVIGSRGGNAALASLLTQLAALGVITDNSIA